MKSTEQLLGFLKEVSLEDLQREDNYGIEVDIKSMGRLLCIYPVRMMHLNRPIRFKPFMVIKMDGTVKNHALLNNTKNYIN